ncbi:uncharacterized protein BCR38DRAFT_428060 [Pseudomassariella vexata]|uniref:Uncharacterized protein n=1 Tax=Pseudomassariella vexata TaxID=1141098 RepID=A0A1Y2E888_9PEZI|nr:uncharacterized protein BCR38DRAFT_428060 [Pseudomassariella vexata]ORY67752.1 hypothetical protein BCR38DRAFT_428060 [Pseudomassariella vexata]
MPCCITCITCIYLGKIALGFPFLFAFTTTVPDKSFPTVTHNRSVTVAENGESPLGKDSLSSSLNSRKPQLSSSVLSKSI